MDRELEAVKAVLGSVPKALRLLDETKREFHPERAGAWSTTELLVVDVAAALWSGRGVPVDFGLLINRLNHAQIIDVLRGVAIYCGQPLPGIAADGTLQ